MNSALPGFRWHAIDPTVPVQGIQTRNAFIEPRAGLSWDPYGTGSTIVRAGGGMYRAHDSYNDASAGLATVEGERTAQVNYINLSSVASQQKNFTNAASFTPDSNVTGYDANDNRQPLVVTYNAAIDQKFGKNNFVEIAYVGNKSTDILNNGANQNTHLDDVKRSADRLALPGPAQPPARYCGAGRYCLPALPPNPWLQQLHGGNPQPELYRYLQALSALRARSDRTA